MAGTTLQPSHEPPCTRDKIQAPITLKIQWKEREKQPKKGKEGEEELDDDCSQPRWLKTPRTAGHTSRVKRHTTAHVLPNRPLTTVTVGTLCC